MGCVNGYCKVPITNNFFDFFITIFLYIFFTTLFHFFNFISIFISFFLFISFFYYYIGLWRSKIWASDLGPGTSFHQQHTRGEEITEDRCN